MKDVFVLRATPNETVVPVLASAFPNYAKFDYFLFGQSLSEIKPIMPA